MKANNMPFLLALLLMNLDIQAQNVDIPEKEFALSLSAHKLELSRNESGHLDIGILKSKGYRNYRVKMGISSSVPKGVTIVFDPEGGNFDFTKVSVLVSNEAVPGTYMLILNATLSHHTKGSILKLIIKE